MNHHSKVEWGFAGFSLIKKKEFLISIIYSHFQFVFASEYEKIQLKFTLIFKIPIKLYGYLQKPFQPNSKGSFVKHHYIVCITILKLFLNCWVFLRKLYKDSSNLFCLSELRQSLFKKVLKAGSSGKPKFQKNHRKQLRLQKSFRLHLKFHSLVQQMLEKNYKYIGLKNKSHLQKCFLVFISKFQIAVKFQVIFGIFKQKSENCFFVTFKIHSFRFSQTQNDTK